ncbi:MAG: hypothetical protein IT440_04580 [Phycisphaeraceae bacterium]|nr:hypothetical protein [Phycisphaeraceae bacterium]
MNDPLAELEHRLRRLQPCTVTSGLNARVGRTIARQRRVRQMLRVIAVAACLGLAAMLLRHPRSNIHPVSAPWVSGSLSAGPTWLNYQQAWHTSPAALDDLLDEHARIYLPGQSHSDTAYRSSL